ncbi:MAG TPA: hypothetical protein VNO14_15895 [Blastocatellia bacterium]|nr:hypothetical protein [Blastocatellia bacterium]
MKECPACGRAYSDFSRFCTTDGTRLIEPQKSASGPEEEKQQRSIPAPPEPLPMRLTIIDQGDEGRRSRVIQGLVLDVSLQGMRIQTGTVETGRLNIIRDHTIAFKNKLEMEVDLPRATVKLTGFAAWYRPLDDGVSWAVGVYIRSMPAADRELYEEYLRELAGQSGLGRAPASTSAG